MGLDPPVTTFEELIAARLLEIGDGYRARNDELGGTGPIFLRAGHMTDTHIDFSGVERFHAYLADRVASKMSVPGDTVVTTKGNSTGRTSYVSSGFPRFVYSPHLCYWRSRRPDLLAPLFLRYWARSQEFTGQLKAMQGSTDMAPYLSLSDQRRLRITLPPACLQHSAGRILGTLDDKIELNRRISETLEAMAQALFKSWFLDFEPVRAKARGRAPSGMDAATAQLFPSELEESAIGLIPKGWSSKPLCDAAALNPTRKLAKGTAAPYVEMASLPTTGHRPQRWPQRAVESGARFQNGDTLLARITPCLENGKTGFVDFLAEGQIGWGSTEYIVIAPHAPFPPEWGYLMARNGDFRNFATRKMQGSTGRQRVPTDALAQYRVAVPSEAVMTRFAMIVKPWFHQLRTCSEQIESLALVRDALLPRLLAGELAAGAERALETAA